MADIVASSASTANVQTAVNAASDGDRVLIPNGSATWTTGISTTKQIRIEAQNYTPTPGGASSRNVQITNDCTTAGTPLITMQSGNTYHVGLSGIQFLEGSPTQNHFRFTGSGTKVPLINDITFQVVNRFGNEPDACVIAMLSLGGVMWNMYGVGAGAGIGGQCCPEGSSMLINSPRGWTTASTMGALDSTGAVNTYIEDSSFRDFGQSPDIDVQGRAVIRYCTLDGLSGLTHGYSSGGGEPYQGGRHMEYYNNSFIQSSTNRNISARYFWLRMGTAVYTDNDVTVGNTGWGQVKLIDIGDTSGLDTYPVPSQPGWGHNGTTDVIDPIYIWNNTGNGAYTYAVVNGWDASNVLLNRDLYVNNGAKPSYSKYTYPHPLRSVVEGGSLIGTLTAESGRFLFIR